MKDYRGKGGIPYEPPQSYGFLSIPVLEFLNGKPWDEVALAYVHALRPSSIRVTDGTLNLDARVWRVTVYMNDAGLIQEIEQEVEVGLPEGIAHGDALEQALHYGIDSPQVKASESNEGFICADGCEALLADLQNAVQNSPESPSEEPCASDGTDLRDFGDQ